MQSKNRKNKGAEPMRLFVAVLLFCFSFGVYADIDQKTFKEVTTRDALSHQATCQKIASVKDKVDILMERSKARGLYPTRNQVQAMLYSACMAKIYDKQLNYMLQALPTSEL